MLGYFAHIEVLLFYILFTLIMSSVRISGSLSFDYYFFIYILVLVSVHIIKTKACLGSGVSRLGRGSALRPSTLRSKGDALDVKADAKAADDDSDDDEPKRRTKPKSDDKAFLRTMLQELICLGSQLRPKFTER